jgi:hypothetical protein
MQSYQRLHREYPSRVFYLPGKPNAGIASQRLAHLGARAVPSSFAHTENLCYTPVDVKDRASKRGFRDRFLVSIPLGAYL